MPRDEPNLQPVGGMVRWVDHPLAHAGNRGVIRLGADRYDVLALEDAAWLVSKWSADNDGYTVTLDPPSCTCMDRSCRKRTCKHVAALAALLNQEVRYTGDDD